MIGTRVRAHASRLRAAAGARSARAARGARPAPRPGSAAGHPPGRRPDRARAASTTCPSFLAAGRPAGGQRLGDAAGRADRPPLGRQRRSRSTSRPGCQADLWVVEPRQVDGRRAGEVLAPAGWRTARRCWRRTPTRAGCGSRASTCRARRSSTWRAGVGRSPTRTCADSWPLEMYQTVYAARAGSAEMPSAGRAVQPGRAGAAGAPRDRLRDADAAHAAWPAWRRTSRRTRSRITVPPGDRRGGPCGQSRAAGGSSRSARPSCGRWRARPTSTAG